MQTCIHYYVKSFSSLKEPVNVRGLIKKSDILITETTGQES